MQQAIDNERASYNAQEFKDVPSEEEEDKENRDDDKPVHNCFSSSVRTSSARSPRS